MYPIRVELSLRLGNREGIWVPRQAVLGQGLQPVVYAHLAAGRYRRQPVKVLAETNDWLRVEGVASGTRIVVAGKMLLEGLYRISAAGNYHEDHHHDDHH